MLHSGCVKLHQKFLDFVGLPMGLLREKSPKTRINTGLFGPRIGVVRSEGCTSCSPVQQALILPYYGFYGSASAEPFLFNRSFPANWGARLRISGGCPGGASRMRISNNCSSIAWAAEPPQRCSPVQQVQQRRPPPAAETGRSCWGRGQQDMRPAQGSK